MSTTSSTCQRVLVTELWHKLQNAGKDGYGMYDYQLLDRIVTLEKKLGMPATFPNWRGPLPSGTAVEFAGALSVPFGCAILKNQPEGQDGDMMLVLDADEVPDVLADAAEGITLLESRGMYACARA